MTPRRLPRPLRAVGALVLAATAMLALGGAASTGSVPDVVQGYVANGMLARLQQVYGPGAGGTGIDFTKTPTLGATVRVHAFTAAFLGGDRTAAPAQIVNSWAVPVSLAGEAVGVATVWIPPAASTPELADFTRGAAFAVALAAVPAEADVVRDDAGSAWYAIRDGAATRLDGGSPTPSPTPLAQIALATGAAAAGSGSDAGPGLVLAIVVLVVLIAVIVAVVALGARRRPRGEPEGGDEPDPAEPR